MYSITVVVTRCGGAQVDGSAVKKCDDIVVAAGDTEFGVVGIEMHA
jgi:hypothetical protein